MSIGTEKEKKQKTKEWTCDWCCGQKTNLQWQRNCPFLPDEDKEDLKIVYDHAPARKYDAPGLRKRQQRLEQQRKKQQLEAEEKGEEPEHEEEKRHAILTVGTYEFYECPVAYTMTDRWAISLISMINWSEDTHTPLAPGGLLNMTNWYFECRNIVVTEQRKIEKEEMDKKRSGSIGKGQGKGKKQGMGRPKGGKGKLNKPSRGIK